MVPKRIENNSEIVSEVGTSGIESDDNIDSIVESGTPTVKPLGGNEYSNVSELQELYDLLFINGCNLTDVNRELNNILLVKLAGIPVTAQERLVLFNTLGRTIPLDVDVVEFYYPLAKYVHLQGCKDIVHSSEDNMACGELSDKLNSFSVMSFEDYIASKVYESGSITLRDAYERIKASDYTLEDVLIELDAIYNLCAIPTDMDEETWNKLFGRLLTTVCEYDNVCFVYYDLALLVHKSVCGYKHITNEFGATECDGMTFKLNLPDIYNT